MFELSQETIAIVTVGRALAGLVATSDNAIGSGSAGFGVESDHLR